MGKLIQLIIVLLTSKNNKGLLSLLQQLFEMFSRSGSRSPMPAPRNENRYPPSAPSPQQHRPQPHHQSQHQSSHQSQQGAGSGRKFPDIGKSTDLSRLFLDAPSLGTIVGTLNTLKAKKALPSQLECSCLMLLTLCFLYKGLKIPNGTSQHSAVADLMADIGQLETTTDYVARDKNIMRFNMQLLPILNNFVKKDPPKDISENMVTLFQFYVQAAKLLGKSIVLDESMSTALIQIVMQTQHIIQNIVEDPDDYSHGSRALRTYLPKVDTLVTEFIRLDSAAVATAAQKETLERSRTQLERFVQAFVAEHEYLLLNNTINLNAELDSNDAILDMHGR